MSLRFVVGLFILILGVHVTAVAKFWYPVYVWLDNPLHLMGGFWLSLLSFWFLEKYQSGQIIKESFLVAILFSLGMTALAGILWEFFEFFYDLTIAIPRGSLDVAQPSSADIMKDFANNLMGAILFLLVYLIYKAKKKI